MISRNLREPASYFLFWRLWPEFKVVQRSVFVAIRNPLYTDLLSAMKLEAVDATTRGGITAYSRRWQLIVGHPMIDQLVPHEHLEFRFAILLVEVDNIQRVAAGVASEWERSGAALRLRALDGFATRSVFPRRHLD